MTSVIGYVRVSTDDQENGHGLDAHETVLREECDRRGWELAAVHRDVASGKTMARRPGLVSALEKCRAGAVDGLMVVKLDRLSRSVIDFANILDDAQRHGYNVVALDLGVDLSTTSGRLVANVMAAVAQWERETISDRTKAGLREARKKGVVLGRPREVDPEMAAWIADMHRQGFSSHRIAARLNEEGVLSPRGGRWWPKVVLQVARRGAEQ